jgi:predicted ATPase
MNKPIVVIPRSCMGPDEFEQAKHRLQEAGYVVLATRSVMVTDKVYLVTANTDTTEALEAERERLATMLDGLGYDCAGLCAAAIRKNGPAL